MMETTTTREVQVTLPLNVLTDWIGQLPTDELAMVQRQATEALRQRQAAPALELLGTMEEPARRAGPPGGSAERGRQLLEQARREKPKIREGFARFLREIGLDPEAPAIPAQELQARIQAGGVRPEDNEFSRELIRMREE
jgi:hypothetical protein